MPGATKTNSVIYGIFNMRCPKCREGRMFPEGTLYSRHFMKMNSHCPRCTQSFMPEPGYYFGAMFVSYALNTILFVAIWLLLTVLFSDVSVTLVLVVLIAALFAFLPVTFRLSRVLWIYIFVRPDKTR
jgi:uncharacterized protein (DUF983 family)